MSDPKYIDAEQLKQTVETSMDMQDLYLPSHFFDVIDSVSAADVVEVVRCKDCQYRYVLNRGGSSVCNLLDAQNNGEAYCSYGERKDG